jgi:predicted PurR-regulated permease PerM
MAPKDKQDLLVKISPSTIIWTIGIVLGVYFLFQVRQIVLTLFFSVIVMSALHPAVTWMQKKLNMPKI